MSAPGAPAPAADGPVSTAIRARGLAKAYDGTPVLRGVDLDVPRGQVFALLGSDRGGQDHDGQHPRHAAAAR